VTEFNELVFSEKVFDIYTLTESYLTDSTDSIPSSKALGVVADKDLVLVNALISYSKMAYRSRNLGPLWVSIVIAIVPGMSGKV
jgi:hypothetical protein